MNNTRITPLPDGGHKLELLSKPKGGRVLTDEQLKKIVSHPETDEAVAASDGQWSHRLRNTCERLEYERNSARATCELMAQMIAEVTGRKPLTFLWQEDDDA